MFLMILIRRIILNKFFFFDYLRSGLGFNDGFNNELVIRWVYIVLGERNLIIIIVDGIMLR